MHEPLPDAPFNSNDSHLALRAEIRRHLDLWRGGTRPSRQAQMDAAEAVTRFRRGLKISSLWAVPPLMATATLDDGFGHGLALIHRFAQAAGLQLLSLGTMQAVDVIIAACRRQRPGLLGLTVLQFDTEPDLVALRQGIPAETRIVAGGPVFTGDPDLAHRAGIDFVAPNAAAFWEYLLSGWPGQQGPSVASDLPV